MAETREMSVGGIALREYEAERIVMLRLRKPAPTAMDALDRLLGVSLPRQPNCAAGSTTRAIWMGPDEWMLVDPPVGREALEAVAGTVAALAVEVGDGRYALDVEGDTAREFLAKAVPVDLHPATFPVDRSAMTLFAQIPVVIDHIAPGSFRLWFDVSLREFVRGYCREALIEFGP